MGSVLTRSGGGISAAVKALLIPSNIKAGVPIKGPGLNFLGTLTYKDMVPQSMVLFENGVLNPVCGNIVRFSDASAAPYISGNYIIVPNPSVGYDHLLGTENEISFDGYDSLQITVQSDSTASFDNSASYGVGMEWTTNKMAFTPYPKGAIEPLTKYWNVSAVTIPQRILFNQLRYNDGRNQGFKIIKMVLVKNAKGGG